jgi:aminoglycoside phosphotransferase (APT) family kinase protein
MSEAQLLAVASEGGVPVPRVVAAGGPGGPPGAAFLVTEWIDGETLPSRIFRDPTYRPGLAGLQRECASALARIHDLPVDATHLRPLDPIEPYRDDLAASGQSHPALEWAYRWLIQNRPQGNPPCIVHGDFRLGNLMVDGRGLRAVLDWELAHIGDPYEDVAWPMVRAWRFDRVRPAGVFPDRESWLSAYGEASGLDVDPDIVRWWEIAGTFKWGVICLTQWLRHRDGATRSVELAAIGRRVAENEYDLLGLIP